MIKISITIATWKRANKLNEIVELLEDQTMPRDEYEIIILDSNSPDETSLVCKKLSEKYSNIVYIKNVSNILAAKRNAGIREAQSDIIVFMDDDVYPSKTFVETHYAANIANTDTFFCGQIRFPVELCKNSNYYRFRDEQHLKDTDKDQDLKYNNIVVMNLSFRKEFIDKVGLVDERFLGYGGEDIEFGYRVVQNGFKLRYLPGALAIHRENSSSIIEYGTKLYKAGLYGGRTIEKINPKVAIKRTWLARKLIKVLSIKIIHTVLGKYLLITDKTTKLYNYFLFKAYTLGSSAQGKKDRAKHPELNNENITNGW